MKNRIRIIMLVALMSLVSFSEVTRARQNYGGDIEIQSFSTKDEKFSGNFDLIIPNILIKKDRSPLLIIKFFEIGKMHGFRKIKISNGENEVVLNVADGELKWTIIDTSAAEFVTKIIDEKDLNPLLDMTRSDKQMKVDFINKHKKVITKEVNAKEKEILRWTILNYEALVNKE